MHNSEAGFARVRRLDIDRNLHEKTNHIHRKGNQSTCALYILFIYRTFILGFLLGIFVDNASFNDEALIKLSEKG